MDYITKSDVQIHTGVQTLQVALNSNADKFGTDPTVVQLCRDQSLVTKCMNSLMGKQEISHQQVMSYLVGGGDTYTSHCFRSFHFYEVLQTSVVSQRPALQETIEEDGDQQIQQDAEHKIIVNVSSGKPVVVSNMLDYELRPVESPFDEMNLWEFVERSQKVSCPHCWILREVNSYLGTIVPKNPMLLPCRTGQRGR